MRRKKQTWTLVVTLAIICVICVTVYYISKDEDGVGKTAVFIPQAPNYTDTTMWLTEDRDTTGMGADVFYVVSTWEEDWKTEDSVVCHYADVWNPVHREHMSREMNRIAAYMAPGNRFYAPYYRHTTAMSARLSTFFRPSVTSRARSSSQASVREVWQ